MPVSGSLQAYSTEFIGQPWVHWMGQLDCPAAAITAQIVALTISMLFAMVGIIAEFVAQDTVYLFLVYFIGGGNIFMYSDIYICQYRFRKRYLTEVDRLEVLNFKVDSYRLAPILGVLAFAAILVVTLLDASEAMAIYVCVSCYLAIYIVSRIYTKKKGVAAANLDI